MSIKKTTKYETNIFNNVKIFTVVNPYKVYFSSKCCRYHADQNPQCSRTIRKK